MSSCNGVRGGKPKCVGVKKIGKKGVGVWKFIPPRMQSVGVLRRYPPVLDPEDLGERKKNQEFSGIFRNFQEYSGKIRNFQEFSGNIRKNQEKLGKIRNFQEFQTPGGPGGEKKFFPKRPWA